MEKSMYNPIRFRTTTVSPVAQLGSPRGGIPRPATAETIIKINQMATETPGILIPVGCNCSLFFVLLAEDMLQVLMVCLPVFLPAASGLCPSLAVGRWFAFFFPAKQHLLAGLRDFLGL
jgi:hypothetical protein